MLPINHSYEPQTTNLTFEYFMLIKGPIKINRVLLSETLLSPAPVLGSKVVGIVCI